MGAVVDSGEAFRKFDSAGACSSDMSSSASAACWNLYYAHAIAMTMEAATISTRERAQLKAQFKKRSLEFQAGSYVFDSAHLLCDELADVSLLLIEERALREKTTEWYVSALHAVLVARRKAGSVGSCTFSLGGKRVERQQVRTALSVSALLEVEVRANGDG